MIYTEVSVDVIRWEGLQIFFFKCVLNSNRLSLSPVKVISRTAIKNIKNASFIKTSSDQIFWNKFHVVIIHSQISNNLDNHVVLWTALAINSMNSISIPFLNRQLMQMFRHFQWSCGQSNLKSQCITCNSTFKVHLFLRKGNWMAYTYKKNDNSTKKIIARNINKLMENKTNQY